MILGDGRAVADPFADDMQRVGFGKLGLPARPQIVKQFRPRLQPGLADDPVELRPQIAVCLPVSGDYPFSARLGLSKHVHQGPAKLRKHWNDATFTAFVVFGFRRRNVDAPIASIGISAPNHVAPFQRQVFAGASQATEPRQGKQQTPLRIRAGFQHLHRHLAGNEELAFLVLLAPDFQTRERAFDYHLPRLYRLFEYLFGCPRPFGDRRPCQLGVIEALPPLLSHHRGYVADRRRFPEMCDQAVSGLLVGGARAGLGLQCREKLIVQIPQGNDPFRPPRLGQAHRDKPIVHLVGERHHPSGYVIIDGSAGDLPGYQCFHFDLEFDGLIVSGLTQPDRHPLAVAIHEQNPFPAAIVI